MALYSFRMESRALAAAGEQETFRRGLQLATRSAVSATLAFGIAQALGLDYPIFALGAAVIPGDLIVLPPAPTITIFDPLTGKFVTLSIGKRP